MYPGMSGRSAGGRKCQTDDVSPHAEGWALRVSKISPPPPLPAPPSPLFLSPPQKNGAFANQFHEDNHCVTPDGNYYSFSACNASNLATTVFQTKNNTLYSDQGPAAWGKTCGVETFEEWQALGQDAGSTTAMTPSIPDLIAMGAAKTLGKGA